MPLEQDYTVKPNDINTQSTFYSTRAVFKTSLVVLFNNSLSIRTAENFKLTLNDRNENHLIKLYIRFKFYCNLLVYLH